MNNIFAYARLTRREPKRLPRLELRKPHRHAAHHLLPERLHSVGRAREHGELSDEPVVGEIDEVDAVERLAALADLRFELESPVAPIVGRPLALVMGRGG